MDMESWTWFIFYLEKIWSSELRQFFIQKKFEALHGLRNFFRWIKTYGTNTGIRAFITFTA